MMSRVGVFVDMENLGLPLPRLLEVLGGRWEMPFDIAEVRRAYGNWHGPELAGVGNQIADCGFERVHVAGSAMRVSNASDVHMAVEMVVEAYEPGLDVVLLLSGDSGFVSAVRQVRSLGALVYGAALEACASPLLMRACDEYEGLTIERMYEPPEPSAPFRDPASSFEELVFSSLADSLASGPQVSYLDLLASIRKRAAADDIGAIHGRATHLEAVIEALRETGWILWHATGGQGQFMLSDARELPSSAEVWFGESLIAEPTMRGGPSFSGGSGRGGSSVRSAASDLSHPLLQQIDDLTAELLDDCSYHRHIVKVA